MAKIFIEKKEIKYKVKETIEDTSFEIIDGQYVENTKLNRRYSSDMYSYLDFNVLFAMENLFDEYYTKIILFNDEKKLVTIFWVCLAILTFQSKGFPQETF